MRRTILLAVWFALLTSLGELTARGISHFIIGRYINVGRQTVWMTPLADLLLFGALVALLWLLSLAWPRLRAAPAATGVFMFVAALSILTMQPWMAWWAMIALALGLAIQSGRLTAAHGAMAERLVQRSLPALAVVVVGLGAATAGRLALAERRALAALPAPAPGAPNVLIIIWDAVRADDLGLYGYGRPTTPRLSAFAARGTTFDRAISPASWTLPTHSSLFTGLWPHQFAASWLTPLETTPPTLAEVLAGRGYRTAAFSANHIVVTWEQRVLRGFSHAEDYVFSAGELARSSALLKWLLGFDAPRAFVGWFDIPGRRDAADIRHGLLSWLGHGRDDRPFFAFLNVYDAHEPYLPPAPFDSLYGWPAGAGAGERRRLFAQSLTAKHELPPAALLRQRDLYDGAITEMDHDLGLLLDTLEARGLLANTLVIIASDHGEEFGEHRSFGHGHDVFLPAVHVPLVIVKPGQVRSGYRVPQLVSLRDVPATIGELLGATPDSWPLPGRSLARFWRDSTTAPDTVLTEVDRLPRGGQAWMPVTRGNVQSIIGWPYQLIRTGDSLELFDIAADPEQARNLAGLDGERPTLDALAQALHRWRQGAVPTKP